MAGFDDNVARKGDWVSLVISPRVHSKDISDDDSRSSKSVLQREPSFNDSKEMADGSQGRLSMGNSEKMDSLQLSDEKLTSRGGLGERMAARAGFNAPRLNTENIRPADFSFDSNARSPCLTIYSPGLSPATLLESPVFLLNPLAQPSPTTGKVPFRSSLNGTMQSSASASSDQSKEYFFEDINASFAFPPVSKVSVFSPGASSQGRTNVESDNSSKSQTVEPVKPISQTRESFHLDAQFFPGSSSEKDKRTNCEMVDQRISDTANESSELSPPIDDPQDQELRQQNGDFMAGVAPEEERYNWRKYSQKQVKDSDYLPGYYRRTDLDWTVTKKVERHSEDLVSELVNEGTHNQPKPQTNRQPAICSSNQTFDLQPQVLEQIESGNVMGRNFVWTNTQQGGTAGTSGSVEMTSAEPAETKFDYSSGALQVQNRTRFQSGEVADASSAFSNGDDENKDNGRTHGNASLGYDESESKRRKLEAFGAEMTGATRAIREPRVVVQTTSDVDIIDDGYRWRKYGQKVVKGNPNPRSYYKCTALGCTVRKHVERASHDLKSVVTTYEGKHNHDVPAARNSSHTGSGGGSSTAQHTVAPSMAQMLHDPSQRFERPVFSSSTTPSSYGDPFSFHQPRQFPGNFGMNQQGFGNVGIPGLEFGPRKMPTLPLYPYLVQQIPKGDPKVEPNSEIEFGLSNSSSIYQQMMNGLPLGPHK